MHNVSVGRAEGSKVGLEGGEKADFPEVPRFPKLWLSWGTNDSSGSQDVGHPLCPQTTRGQGAGPKPAGPGELEESSKPARPLLISVTGDYLG